MTTDIALMNLLKTKWDTALEQLRSEGETFPKTNLPTIGKESDRGLANFRLQNGVLVKVYTGGPERELRSPVFPRQRGWKDPARGPVRHGRRAGHRHGAVTPVEPRPDIGLAAPAVFSDDTDPGLDILRRERCGEGRRRHKFLVVEQDGDVKTVMRCECDAAYTLIAIERTS